MFNTPYGLRLTTSQVAEEIIRFMKADNQRRYKIVIGTDSDGFESPAFLVDFVTAIVVQRVGNGGRYFWRRAELGKFHTLRDRITQEVMLSLEAAKEILTVLKTQETPDFDFEIHVDVGEKGETKTMIQEVVGMIRANNFEARTKPESYAASNVADRHV
jgi:predicted RNase H-related nuclease YkuK (DUF458 family)